ncbi:MAG: hypothetical protein GY708_12010, partial [Actinomycetia bacterium]|nr:hypothetical protein [Actinomycetes bacterium]
MVVNDAYVSLVGSGDQTLAGTGAIPYLDVSKPSGDVLLPGDFRIDSTGSFSILTGSGLIRNTGGRLVFAGGSTDVDFTGTIDDVEVDGSGLELLQDLAVNDTLTITSLSSLRGPGDLKVSGGVTSNDASWVVIDDAYVSLVGSTDQTLTGSGYIPYLDVSKPSGDVLLPSDFLIDSTGSFRWLTGSGRFRNTGGRLIFDGNTDVDFAGTIDDLVLDGNGTVEMLQDLAVGNDLTITNLNVLRGPGVLKVTGDVTADDSIYRVISSAYVRLVGSADQTLTGSGALAYLDVSKPSGDVLLPGDFRLAESTTGPRLTGGGWIRNTGGRLVFDDTGTLDFSGSVDDLELVGSGAVTLPQDLVVNDTLTITSLSSLTGPGDLKVSGGVTSNDASWVVINDAYVSLVG